MLYEPSSDVIDPVKSLFGTIALTLALPVPPVPVSIIFGWLSTIGKPPVNAPD